MPAMTRALQLLPTMEFPQSGTLVPELARLYKSASKQQKQFWDEVAIPKDQRRVSLTEKYICGTRAGPASSACDYRWLLATQAATLLLLRHHRQLAEFGA
jgi:hypothetical protein